MFHQRALKHINPQVGGLAMHPEFKQYHNMFNKIDYKNDRGI